MLCEEYAGSPMDTGPEAKAYSDHYILAHMNASSEELAGEVLPYAAVSAKARELGAAVAENPNATQAEIDEAAEWGALKQSLLDGNTLRGLLLYGYAFATIGTIAGIAAIRFIRCGGPDPGARPARVLARTPGRAHCRAHCPGTVAHA